MTEETHSTLSVTIPFQRDTATSPIEVDVEVDQRLRLNERGAITGIQYAIYAPESLINWDEDDEETVGTAGRAIAQAVLTTLLGNVHLATIDWFVMVGDYCIFTSEELIPLTPDELDLTSGALRVLFNVLAFAVTERSEEHFNSALECQACVDIARLIYPHFASEQDAAKCEAAIGAMVEAKDAMFPADGENVDINLADIALYSY